ncbi:MULTISPECIES: hypothetical protein [unclassified Nocardiopsis]|uniref:hypothetical protein n=1 Tax=unclassified Nocardiopsis TaxID=2649073 RepID=UPI0033F3B130
MSGPPSEEIVLDTGPLSHLTEAGWLGVLRTVAGPRTVVITGEVEHELRQGAHTRPYLQQVLGAEWPKRHTLESGAEIESFARFSEFLVAGGRNVGESSVLAYAQVHKATAVIDDRAARRLAQDAGIPFQGTLGLLCEAIRAGLLTTAMVGSLADHLLETAYHLPFPAGGFERWANDHGIISPRGG